MNKEYLELNLLDIKKIIAKQCYFDLSHDYILNEKVIFNPLIIIDNNKKVSEALEFIIKNSRLSLEGVKNLNYLVNKLRINSILNENELLEVLQHFNAVKRIRSILFKNNVESLKDYSDSLFFCEESIFNINRCIDLNAKIKEDASDIYKQLNEKLTKHTKISRDLIKKLFVKYEDSLQEKVVYTRENRNCFLIKNRDKNSLKGMIHGESTSKISTYFEPSELVEYNNQHIEILEAIEKERTVILKQLTQIVMKNYELIKYNLESLMMLDVVFAKANYGFENMCSIASFNRDYNLQVKDFFHPLINPEKVTSNSFNILSTKRQIIISGSNTGGKTIILKSIALSVIMAYLAIPIPCQSANIPFYDSILYAIDDLQSIEKSLSTFSANLSSLNNILNNATDKSLVLIDELGNGTDPQEGEALALAIIKKLVNKNISLVCTTHFSKIKEFALENPTMMLSSVGFNQNTLQPTYKYIENDYGYSNSFKIAEKYLDFKDIIKDATTIYNENKGESTKLLKELEELKKQLVIDKKKLDDEILANKEIINEYKQKLNDIKLNKQKIVEQFKIDYQQKLEEFKLLLKEKLIKNDADINFELEEDDIEVEDSFYDFKVGDIVKLKLTAQNAVIEKITNNSVELLINNKVMKTTLDKISKTDLKELKSKIQKKDIIVKSSPKDLNVIGKTSEEALHEVSLYIDKLLLAKVKFGHIIHGVGKGILKDKIYNYLKSNPYVKEFKMADFSNGGFGATDITLK